MERLHQSCKQNSFRQRSLIFAYGCVWMYYLQCVPEEEENRKEANAIEEDNTRKIYVSIENPSSCEKIFAAWRFDGTNYLAKRIFAEKLIPGTRKRQLAYDGQAMVVVTEQTPIRLEYDC